MHDAGRRIALSVLLLSALWIAVYWWWPAEPPIRFAAAAPPASEPATARAADPATPHPDPAPKPEPQPPAVIPPEFFDHTVQAGETFEAISRRYFGTSAHAEAIARSNPFVDPARLKAGRVVRVPRDPGNIQGIPTKANPPPPAPPDPSPSQDRFYTVKPGDSLSRIAKEMYADASLARLIFEANRDVLKDEDSLSVGQKLRIPPKPKP